MEPRVAAFFYQLALLTLGAGPATKVLLNRMDLIWLDPALIFSAFALLALLPHLASVNTAVWRDVRTPLLALVLICAMCVLSGFLLMPTGDVYDALREPMRFLLMLVWFAVSCWFLEHQRRMVIRYVAAGASLGLLSGIYVYCAALRALPGPAPLIAYAQQYWIRQAVWFQGYPIPRMGGLFIEAPPFGLFMIGLVVFFLVILRSEGPDRTTLFGLVTALAGTAASLADQVMAGAVVCIAASALSIRTQNRWLRPAVLGAAVGLLAGAAVLSLRSKLVDESAHTAPAIIYSNSVGERNFHMRYGIALLSEHPAAMLFGIGPGRYGEYVAETGLFPATVTMQYTAPEILVEWGIAGAAVWLVVLVFLCSRAYKSSGWAGPGMLLGLLIADSFQANWKSETVFLAAAAIYVCRNKVPAAEFAAQARPEAAR